MCQITECYREGREAANEKMRQEHRTDWNTDDYNEAVSVTNRCLYRTGLIKLDEFVKISGESQHDLH